ncbi:MULTISPECIES: site-specific integrase [Pseudomonas]|uniref:Site-specific integrase n=2 Tax=Pseudomonas TaxID=286 RepID=A0A7W2KKP8_9PSED|nr:MULTISPECIES: site-specific integrase [Pseudomonas]MBA6100320.1 site-specific integrase [Pseudomonas juntendi]MBA6118288.1 site-specific integrase [Pseudomonas putida]
MARLRHIEHFPRQYEILGENVVWTETKRREPISSMPVLFWNDSSPWREANLWALERADSGDVSIDTVRSNMTSLLMYANWLEASGTDWWHFPLKKSERCLVMYRGFVVRQRDNDVIAPSTASQRMRDVISFYRWLRAANFLISDWPLWKEHNISIRFTTDVGFQRTMMIQTTDLAIKNRRRSGVHLEDGVTPVSSVDRDAILEFVKQHGSWEVFLLLTLGFFTGMRIGTLCDLKIDSLRRATREPLAPSLYRIAIGPAARPTVKTKYDVSGHCWITAEHRDLILRYADSSRRISRANKAKNYDSELIFLSKNGNPYVRTNTQRSSSVNVEMHELRKKAKVHGITAFEGFYFHQTRATFATQLATALLPLVGVAGTVGLVREAMLHRDESTTLKYIKFVQQSPIKEAIANEFTKAFMGVASSLIGNEHE